MISNDGALPKKVYLDHVEPDMHMDFDQLQCRPINIEMRGRTWATSMWRTYLYTLNGMTLALIGAEDHAFNLARFLYWYKPKIPVGVLEYPNLPIAVAQ